MIRNEGTHSDTVFGMAWYRPDQWQRLREVSSDAEDLEDSYDEWFELAEERMRDLREAGARAERVQIDVEELARWCDAEECPVDAAGRARYAAHLLRSREASDDE